MVTGMATVMAMVQKVLERVDCPARRALPSASDRRPGKEVRDGGRGGQTSASWFGVALICVALPAHAQVGDIAPALEASQTPNSANPATDARSAPKPPSTYDITALQMSPNLPSSYPTAA